MTAGVWDAIRAASPFAMAALYALAGLNHFRAPGFYLRVMPPYLPRPELLNVAAGVSEICLGAGLAWPAARPLAARGVIALLIAVLPVHVYMLTDRRARFPRFPAPLLWLRLAAQGALVGWAYAYT